MAMARGMHKVEFFTHIDEIRSMYEGGYVVLKILYKELKKKYNWSMSYWSFCKYMKEEVIHKDIHMTPKNETIETTFQSDDQSILAAKNISENTPVQKDDTSKNTDTSNKNEKQRLAQEILERNAAFIPDRWK
jgi:hypothetical protein